MQMLGTWLRWPLIGILVPVPLFVLGHGYSWLGQIDMAVFALAMGLLAWKTGGLEIPILLHAANNWTLFAIAPLIPGFTEQGEVELMGFVLAMVPMVLLSAGIWWWYSQACRSGPVGAAARQRADPRGVERRDRSVSAQTRPPRAAMTSRPCSV